MSTEKKKKHREREYQATSQFTRSVCGVFHQHIRQLLNFILNFKLSTLHFSEIKRLSWTILLTHSVFRFQHHAAAVRSFAATGEPSFRFSRPEL